MILWQHQRSRNASFWNVKPAFSNSPSLKNVFEKLRVRDELVIFEIIQKKVIFSIYKAAIRALISYYQFRNCLDYFLEKKRFI